MRGRAISCIYAHLYGSGRLELIKEMWRDDGNCSATAASCLRCKAWPRRFACQEISPRLAFIGARPRSLCARPRATRTSPPVRHVRWLPDADAIDIRFRRNVFGLGGSRPPQMGEICVCADLSRPVPGYGRDTQVFISAYRRADIHRSMKGTERKLSLSANGAVIVIKLA
jgi:hypothetical protein